MYPVLEKVIKSSGYTLEELAEEMGISVSALQRKRHGQTQFKIEEAILLKDILEFEGSVDDLFF